MDINRLLQGWFGTAHNIRGSHGQRICFPSLCVPLQSLELKTAFLERAKSIFIRFQTTVAVLSNHSCTYRSSDEEVRVIFASSVFTRYFVILFNYDDKDSTLENTANDLNNRSRYCNLTISP